MEIKNSSDLPGAQPGTTRVSDLLTQLRAAGSIEAEVVKLLQDNKLLLNTRLGQILTSNKLHYRPGDRVILRLDDSGQQPVLKVGAPAVKSVSLDSRQHPELVRQLPPDQPVLARVVNVVAQRAEVQLAEQLLKLPRQVTAVRNQILSLRRSDANRSIEVTPIDRKVIYKAILQQLVPRREDGGASSLVRLLGLVSRAAAIAERSPGPRVEFSRPPRPATGAAQVGDPRRPKPAADAPRGSAGASPAGDRLQTVTGVKPGTSAGNAGPTPLSFAITAGKPLTTIPAAMMSGANADRPGAVQPLARSDYKPNTSVPTGSPVKPGLAQAARAAVISGASDAAPTTARRARAETTAGGAPLRPSTNPRAPAATAGARATMSPVRDASAADAVVVNTDRSAITAMSEQTISGLRSTPPALQPLLQLVARLPEIDAAQVKRGFELSRLIKQSKSENTASSTLDVFRVLKQFAERESLNRELSQLLQPNVKNRADGDTAPTRAPVQDAQLLQMREVMKLADQSLSHNLLQRATLGLQQETQQPLSVSLALPFLDDQAVKPIQIDLAERRQTQSEDDKSWDIRLGFELAGLGPIACHLVLEGRAIAASFFSEHELTRDRIEAELPLLRQQLSSAGFTPGEFHSFPGAPASLQASKPPEFSEALVDIEA